MISKGVSLSILAIQFTTNKDADISRFAMRKLKGGSWLIPMLDRVSVGFANN